MAFHCLDFDQSEDAHGTVTWDALASPAPAHNAALLAEVARLLDQLHAMHGAPGPLEESHVWDCDLQIRLEDGTRLDWHWHTQRLQYSCAQVPMDTPSRLTLSLCLTGGPALAHTLEQAALNP